MRTKPWTISTIIHQQDDRSHEQGLTLVESILATVFFGVAVAVVLPGFMNFQTATLSNEGKLGAVAISQKVLDELRRVDATTLPNAGTFTTLPSGQSTASMDYLGKTYKAEISYCQRTPSPCDRNTRQIQVQVFLYGNTNPIYTVETLYTKFGVPTPTPTNT